MDRQARTRDTVLVKIREMTGRSQTLPWWLGGKRGKDDRKPNKLAKLCKMIYSWDQKGSNLVTLYKFCELARKVKKTQHLFIFFCILTSCVAVFRRVRTPLYYSTTEAEYKEKLGVWDRMPELTITLPYVHSRVDYNTFTMGIPMPESTL
jgi:hypothetical protein